MEIFTQNAKETFELGEKYGASLKGGEIITLLGEMGAGKTTFVQGVAKGLLIEKNITSPTFILMRTYAVNKGKIKNLYHIDLYRLTENVEEELENLGVKDLWGRKDNVFIIEWAQKLREYPKNTKSINIENISPDVRKITYETIN